MPQSQPGTDDRVDASTLWLLCGFGLLTGGFLALGAIGMSLLTGVTGFLSIAYGEWLTLAAFLAFTFNVTVHLNLWVAAACGIVAMTVLGTVLARVTFEPIQHRSTMTLLVTSLGLTYVMQNVVIAVWGTDVRSFDLPLSLLSPVSVGPLRLTTISIATIVTGLVAMLVVAAILKRTRIGRQMRAVSDDQALARAAGINVRRVRRWTWTIGSAIAATAGVMLAMTSQLSPLMGFNQMLIIASAVIIGGAGHIYGAAVAAFVLGFSMEMSTAWIDPSLKPGIAFVVLILVLLIRPRGLFVRGVQAA